MLIQSQVPCFYNETTIHAHWHMPNKTKLDAPGRDIDGPWLDHGWSMITCQWFAMVCRWCQLPLKINHDLTIYRPWLNHGWPWMVFPWLRQGWTINGLSVLFLPGWLSVACLQSSLSPESMLLHLTKLCPSVITTFPMRIFVPKAGILFQLICYYSALFAYFWRWWFLVMYALLRC